jgi:hypothetical protein
MDKITRYRLLIKELLSQEADFVNRVSQSGLETYAILDDAHDHYLLLRAGWEHKKRIRTIIIYLRLHNGKIWVEEDWTEEGITSRLLEAGVPKEDIVLGFHAPEMRPLTEFAVA